MFDFFRKLTFLIRDYFRQEKYEKLKAGPPKHDFNDPNFIETREKILDETDEAFEAGKFYFIFVFFGSDGARVDTTTENTDR